MFTYLFDCTFSNHICFLHWIQLAKDKTEELEKSNSIQAEKVAKFLGTEKSITTKRENPFNKPGSTNLDNIDEHGPSSSKKSKKIEDGATEESIINTS